MSEKDIQRLQILAGEVTVEEPVAQQDCECDEINGAVEMADSVAVDTSQRHNGKHGQEHQHPYEFLLTSGSLQGGCELLRCYARRRASRTLHGDG